MQKSYTERIATLKTKKAGLDKRLNALEAKLRLDARKLDTRRKIIIGGLVLAHMEKDPSFADRVCRLLAEGVTRQHDKTAIEGLLKNAPAAPVAKPVVRSSKAAARNVAAKPKTSPTRRR